MLFEAVYIASMEEHKGKIVEEAIKKSGYQVKALAERLGIARNTLYTKMREADLDNSFIIKVSKIIHYDFSLDFPNLYNTQNELIQAEDPKGIYNLPAYRNPDFIELQELDRKYLKLLEDYNKLLKLLILLANSNELMGIKKEITEFLENEEKET
jgi:transposase-like protein